MGDAPKNAALAKAQESIRRLARNHARLRRTEARKTHMRTAPSRSSSAPRHPCRAEADRQVTAGRRRHGGHHAARQPWRHRRADQAVRVPRLRRGRAASGATLPGIHPHSGIATLTHDPVRRTSLRGHDRQGGAPCAAEAAWNGCRPVTACGTTEAPRRAGRCAYSSWRVAPPPSDENSAAEEPIRDARILCSRDGPARVILGAYRRARERDPTRRPG